MKSGALDAGIPDTALASLGEGIVQLAQQRVLELTSALHLQQPTNQETPVPQGASSAHVSPPPPAPAAQSAAGRIAAQANSLEDLKQQELDLKVTSELKTMLQKAQGSLAGDGAAGVDGDASTLQVERRRT